MLSMLEELYTYLEKAEKTIVDSTLSATTETFLYNACEIWAELDSDAKNDWYYLKIEDLLNNLNEYYEPDDDTHSYFNLANLVRDAKNAIASKISSCDEDSSEEDEFITAVKENVLHSEEGELIAAIRENDLDEVQYLIRHGAKINVWDSDGNHAIELAKKLGHKEIAAFLEGKIISRQKKTSLRFFDINRSNNLETLVLETLFEDSRTQADKIIIPISGVPGRRVIMADAGVIKHALGDKKITRREDIVEELHWHNGGHAKSGTISAHWKWEYLSHSEELTICSQYHPVIGHLGNLSMKGIKDYGEGEKNILSYIYESTKDTPYGESKPERERQLAELFLECVGTGDHISIKKLRDHNFPLRTITQFLVDHLNRILVLTGIKEITRRWCSPVDLPLGIAYLQGLVLVADGDLRMEDIFNKNAPYGLPTASSLQSSHVLSAAEEKLKKLNLLFSKKYPDIETREDWHQFLLKYYRGESDSDGDFYYTSDDESNSFTLSEASDSDNESQVSHNNPAPPSDSDDSYVTPDDARDNQDDASDSDDEINEPALRTPTMSGP